MNQTKIGWIGLGNMGTPMATNLLKAGFNVTVFNRTPSKTKSMVDAGAAAVSAPANLFETCDLVVSMVSNDDAVKQLYLGENGLLSSAHTKNKIAIDMSTISPDTSRLIAASCKEKGVDFLDAPVSGSVKPAQDGTLIIMVGGESAVYEKAKPIFDILGKLSIHLGESGMGSAAKLAINFFLGLNIQGIAETVLFAKDKGISAENMLTIINEGACGSGISHLKSSNILNNNFTAAFALKHLAKDLRLAKEAGLHTPLLNPLFTTYQNAEQDGLGNEDVMAVIKYLEKNN
jgi:3-hydroxyisobutyrate dehydrogenase